MSFCYSKLLVLPTELAIVVLILAGFGIVGPVNAQDGKLRQAMAIKPKQDVDYEQPGSDVLKDCTFATTKDPSGFVVHHASGRILRRFIDNNGDNKLDQWSYYQNGLEVYRDLDTNFDGRTDEYRWLGPAGTRWGVDRNQDGKIDAWKLITAEEVAMECFEAIRTRDEDRFNRVLLSESELDSLKLGSQVRNEVLKRTKKARAGFTAMARSQKAISADTKFIDSGNGRPQMMPSGTLGNDRDLIVYDQASGFFDAESANQIALGSIVNLGSVWKIIELPEIVDPQKPLTNGGAFFPIPSFGASGVVSSETDETLAKLYDALTELDQNLESAKGAEVEKLEKRKADILQQFYLKTNDPKTKQEWLQNLADSVAHSYQTDRFDGGLKYLEDFVEERKGQPGMDYVEWTAIFAGFGWANSNGDKQQREKAYDRMIEQLEVFQQQYPTSPKTADALIQLAIHHEVNSSDEPAKAIDWYKEAVKRFPETKYGQRAAGAIKRLSGFGETVSLTGKQLDGSNFDLRSLRGKIVVLHFWETWCCNEEDVEELAKLAEKYEDELVIVGCNIEGSRPGESDAEATERFKEFLKDHPDMTWIQVHAPGSVEDSPLAHQLGIATEPMVFLIDKKNNLVESNIGINSLEREIVREQRR